MGNRCSIQQGEENNCWLEQSPEKSTVSTVPLFLGHPVYVLFRDATFQEISWNQEFQIERKKFRKNEWSLNKSNWSKRKKKLKNWKFIKFLWLKTKMGIYFILYCSVRYFSTVIKGQRVNSATKVQEIWDCICVISVYCKIHIVFFVGQCITAFV